MFEDGDFLQKLVDEARTDWTTVPARRYHVRRTIRITRPLKLAAPGSEFVFDFPSEAKNPDGSLISIDSSDVTLVGLSIVGANLDKPIPGVNRYAISSNPKPGRRHGRIRIADCRFTRLMQRSGVPPATKTVTHGVFLRQADDVIIE